MIVTYGIGRNITGLDTPIVTMGYGVGISKVTPTPPISPGYFGAIPTKLPKLSVFTPKTIKELDDDEEILLLLALFK
jgi:hypothetical protein